jgi:hypothetical protein
LLMMVRLLTGPPTHPPPNPHHSRTQALVAVGDRQSTFSSTAWHMSLRAEGMYRVADSGQCRAGPGGMWALKNFGPDDPALKEAFRHQLAFDAATDQEAEARPDSCVPPSCRHPERANHSTI